MRKGAFVDTTFFAQVEPEFSRYGKEANREDALVNNAKVTRITQSRPSKPKPGTVLVKLTIRIPVAAFLPLRPEAVVVIPEAMTEAVPIEVEAAEPHDN